MNIFDKLKEYDYEEIRFMQDKSSGLKAITVIHDTTLGPALGGLRYWSYESEEDAIIDCLKLARGMTYKNAACGLNLGGAKTVILKEEGVEKSEEMMRALGRFIDGFNGRYFIGEDVGTTVDDMNYIYQETPYVLGSSLKVGASGDPSVGTALGTYVSMKAACEEVYGSDSLRGKKVILQGLGHVGLLLSDLLIKDGAYVVGYDLDSSKCEACSAMGVDIVDPDALFTEKADIYSPCALGGTVNSLTIDAMKDAGIKIIAGSANNQLENESKDAQSLVDAGILYVPDFIISSGGVLNASDEFNGGFNKERAEENIRTKIYKQTKKVFEIAKRDQVPTPTAAYTLAEERIGSVLNTKHIFRRRERSNLNLNKQD